MENKEPTNPLDRKEKFLYTTGADGTCEFENGETLQVNRSMLAFHSKFFMVEFFGPTPKFSVKIISFDLSSFKTFLDCLFGLKDYTVLDALMIYPIAHQYEVKESLEKCSAVLEPKDMNENVCLTLNLALFFDDDELVNKVMDVIKTKCGVINLLENKKYCYSLDPLAISKLIESVNLNSLVWKLVYEWKKSRNGTDMKSFLLDRNVFSKMKTCHFESVKSLLDFHFMTNGTLLGTNKILLHLSKTVSNLPDNSTWVKVDNTTFLETFSFSNSLCGSYDEPPLGLWFEIWINKILIENDFRKPTDILKATVRYDFRHVSVGQSSWMTSTDPIRKQKKYFLEISRFSKSDPDEFTETKFDDTTEKPLCTFHIDVPYEEILEIKSIEIRYTFNFSCRILKTSFNSDFVKADKLCFTKNVIVM